MKTLLGACVLMLSLASLANANPFFCSKTLDHRMKPSFLRRICVNNYDELIKCQYKCDSIYLTCFNNHHKINAPECDVEEHACLVNCERCEGFNPS